MATRTTKLIEGQLTAIGVNPAAFAATFDLWKQAGATGEYESYLFGKDGAYVRPTVAGRQYALMHVHLVPLRDPVKLKSWKRAWQFRRRKTSDRALVYVADKTYGYLLIAILDEPMAHQIAKMETLADQETMLRLAKVAEAFLSSGQIIA